MRSTQMISIRNWRTSRCLTLSKVLFSAFDFPHETSTLKTLQTILTKCDTHARSLSPAQSIYYAWGKNLIGKTPQNIPILMYIEGNKSYWALHTSCWKVQAQQLIIITAFNTELPLLLFESVLQAGRGWWSCWLVHTMCSSSRTATILHPAATVQYIQAFLLPGLTVISWP